MSDTSSEPNYQDILNKYAAEINQNPPEPEPQPQTESDSQPEPAPESIASLPQPEPQPEPIAPPQPETVSEPVVPPQPEPITPPPAPPAPPVIPPSDDLYTPLTSEPVTDKGNSFFKVLFFISLFLFLGVVAAVVYSFINSQKPLSNNQNTPSTGSSPTISASTCKINEQEYSIGESFAATDGCNTCTCHPDLTISCTEKACDTTPTKSATTSANIKNYSNSVFAFSFSYPSDLTVVDLLPKTYTKISTTHEYLTLENKDKTFSLTLMVNPDGFGPLFSNKDYTLSYQTGKGLISTIKATNTPDENFDKTKDFYMYSGEVKKDFNLLIMTTSSKGFSSDKIIKQILSTFKLL